MKSRRVSSRLNVKFRSTFSNSSGNPLAIDDDDDDFVNPPRVVGDEVPAEVNVQVPNVEVPEGQDNVQRGEVPVEENMEDRNDQDAGAQQMEEIVRLAVKHVYVRKGKGKRNDAGVLEDRPQVKRKRKTKEEKQKQLEDEAYRKEKETRSKKKFDNLVQSSKSKPKEILRRIKTIAKKVGRKNIKECREAPVEEKKQKGIPWQEHETRSLKTRMTPLQMTTVVKNLTYAQQQSVIKMGLGSLLKVNIDNLPGKIDYVLLDNFDAQSCRLVLRGGIIEMNKEMIYDVMGIPKEGVKLLDIPECDKDDEVLKLWHSQFPGKKYSTKAYAKLVMDSKRDDLLFRLNFLVLFINSSIESKQMGTCNTQVVEHLINVEDYSKIDWCAYFLESFKSRKTMWDRDDKRSYYSGPITVLLLSYVYCTTIPKTLGIKKNKPFLNHVSGRQLLELQTYEEGGYGYGGGQLIGRQEVEEEEEEDEGVDMAEFDDKFVDEEAFCAVVEMGFNKIMGERVTIAKALTNGLKKFPNSSMLLEWKHTIDQIFCQEKEEEGDEIISKENSDEETQSEDSEMNRNNEGPVPGNEGNTTGNEVDEGQQRENEGSKKGKTIDEGFKTPVHTQKQTTFDTSDFTESQFFEIPGVIEEVEAAIEKATSCLKDQQVMNDEACGSGGQQVKEGVKMSEENEAQGVVLGKRKVKMATTCRSPFIDRITKINERVKPKEKGLFNALMASDRENHNVIWENENGDTLTHGFALSFAHNMHIHWMVIDCWSSMLNYMESFKSESAPLRVFLPTQMLTDEMVDESELEYNRLKEFNSLIDMVVVNWDIKESFTDVSLVFFPMVENGLYYLICFDLRKGKYLIIDHLKRGGSIDRAYGKKPRLLQKFFCNYLQERGNAKHQRLWEKLPIVFKLPWEINTDTPESGLYLMRHMECYMGEDQGKWDAGFGGKSENNLALLARLRFKYLYKLLTCEMNEHHDEMIAEADDFAKKDVLETSLLVEEAKNRRQKRPKQDKAKLLKQSRR